MQIYRTVFKKSKFLSWYVFFSRNLQLRNFFLQFKTHSQLESSLPVFRRYNFLSSPSTVQTACKSASQKLKVVVAIMAWQDVWVRLSVCLPVRFCLQHNSKMNDPKVFKLGIGMTLGYTRNDVVLALKDQRSMSQDQ